MGMFSSIGDIAKKVTGVELLTQVGDKLLGKDAQRAAEDAARLQASALGQAGELQATAIQQATDIQKLAAKEASGVITAAEQESLAGLRQQFEVTQGQLQQQQQGLSPFRETELAGLQRQQQALGGQAQLAGGAQQQLGSLLGFGGAEAQQQAQAGVLDSPAQQALRNRAAKLSTRTASAIGGLGGGNIRSALFEQGRALDEQALQQRISQLGSVSQFGTQGLGLGGTGLQTQLAGQQAQLGSQQAGQIAQGVSGIGRAQAGGILTPAQIEASGITGVAGAKAGALTGQAEATASGILGGEQARSQALSGLLQLGGQIGGAMIGKPPGV
jgi:hypothetical protein